MLTAKVRASIYFLFVVMLLSCAGSTRPYSPKGPARLQQATLPYQSKTAFVNGIHINYLDWQGTGPILIMIHGLGNTPHVFDDLAEKLKGQYHIIAYARRGHGHSEEPDGPYDLSTLVEDLKQLMDTLHIENASLLGWSMGGNEITSFAGLYPARTNKLVYLEAGYDWSDPVFSKSFGKILTVNTPSSNDMRSIDAFKNWYHAAWIGSEYRWTPALEAYILDASRVDSTGRVTTVPGPKAAALLFQSLASSPRDYKKVKAPALAIYATRFFPADVGIPGITQQVNDWEKDYATPFRQQSMKHIQTELPDIQLLQLPNTTHMSIGIYNTDSLAGIINNFLNTAQITLHQVSPAPHWRIH